MKNSITQAFSCATLLFGGVFSGFVMAASCPDTVDLKSKLGSPIADDYLPNTSSQSKGSCAGNGSETAFTWVAPADGDYTFNTNGSNFDTVIYAYKGCSQTELVCNDDGGDGLNSLMDLSMEKGQKIKIVVDSYRSSVDANFKLNVSRASNCGTPPCLPEPVKIGDRGSAPSVDVDSAGNVHVSYTEPRNGTYKTHYARFDANTNLWSSNELKYGSTNSVIKAGQNGDIYHLYARRSGPIFMNMSHDYGQTWETVPLNANALIQNSCDLAVDSQSRPHAVCNVTHSISPKLRYYKWNGSHWETTDLTSAENGLHSVGIQLDSNDKAHVVYMEHNSSLQYDIMYMRDLGDDWSQEVAHTFKTTHSLFLYAAKGFVVDSDDKPHLAIRTAVGRTYKVQYVHKQYGTWQVEDTGIENTSNEEPHNSSRSVHLILGEYNHPMIMMGSVKPIVGQEQDFPVTLHKRHYLGSWSSANLGFYSAEPAVVRKQRLLYMPYQSVSPVYYKPMYFRVENIPSL